MFKTKYAFLAVLGTLFPLSINGFENRREDANDQKPKIHSKVLSETMSLNTPVSQIDDGAVYYIRSAGYANRYWDVYYGNYTNGNHIQIYPSNLSTAQKFIVKKQFDHLGNTTYRISPLGAYDKILRFANRPQTTLTLNDELYSQYDLFADKFIFEPSGTNKFLIKTGSSSFQACLIPESSDSGAQLISRLVSPIEDTARWELLKVDYLGLDVCNKVNVNGTLESRHVVCAPATADYIIETQYYPGNMADTILTLRTGSENEYLASDDDGGTGTNARIIYHMTKGEHYAVYLRGFHASCTGYTYLVFRPLESVYMAGTFDYEDQNVDRISALNDAKPALLDLGYFPRVYANCPHSEVLDTDASDQKRIDHDYFIFYGHGYEETSEVAFYNGSYSNIFGWYDIPPLSNSKAVVWLACHSARPHPNGQNPSTMRSMASQTVAMGADYSVGWDGVIYNLVCNHFPTYFFSALNENGGSVRQAVNSAVTASINAEWWWWNAGRFFIHPLDDFDHPITYPIENTSDYIQTNGEGLRPSENIQSLSGEEASLNELRKHLTNDEMSHVAFKNGYFTNRNEKFFLKENWDASVNTYLLSATRNDETVVKYHTHLDNEDYFFASISNPTSLCVRFIDLKNRIVIPSSIFQSVMESGFREATR